MTQLALDREIIVDSFAGGGGASTGIEAGFGGRPVAIAINHDPEAIALHRANHPLSEHYCESVFDVDPVAACKGRPVGLAWFSPDCKHHSKARGGRPVEKNIRGLAWVALKWAGTVRPRVIMLENVEEFQDWGPLVARKSYGQPVPLHEQELVACPKRRGQTFRAFVRALQRKGYVVEWRELKACDLGTPTIRKRLFLVARCDGQPIVWPTPTHGRARGLKPFLTAAHDVIDWSLPCPSIFARKKPLAENTLKRIARGLEKFVLNNPQPFIVPVGYGERKGQKPRVMDINDPLHTVVASANKFGLVTPYLTRPFGQSTGSAIDEPCGTVMAGGAGKIGLVSAFLAQHNTGVIGRKADDPLSTITARGTQQAVVTAHMLNLKGKGGVGIRSIGAPLAAVCAGGTHAAVVEAELKEQDFGPDQIKEGEQVAAFLTKYYSSGENGVSVEAPLHTLTTKDRMGLVQVSLQGRPYVITDIGMRMLSPRELYRAQGFPTDYIIDTSLPNGKRLTKTAQVRMCGNSVCPPVAEALVRANFAQTQLFHREAAE